MTSLLTEAFVYLAAAVIFVPLCKQLGLGSVLGYLLAGIAIGPVLGLVGEETQDIQHIAEFGVVMMLFLVGLELEPRHLWKLRHKLLGLGGLQVLLTLLLISAAAVLLGLPWQSAIGVGCVLALSSTAIVMQTLGEKGLTHSPGGESSFSVLLFQDIAVIPMLALLPLLALPELGGHHGDDGHASANLLVGMHAGWQALIVLAVMATIVVGGHYLTRPIFRFLARTRLREVFTLYALALVIGIAALMSLIGMSPALGTFLAGVVLATSEYRHELESNIEPFKGLLLGLFFMTVGAGVNFPLLFAEFGTIVGLTFGVMLIKGVVLAFLGKVFRLRGLSQWLFALALAQAGEFGFVLLSFTVQNGVMSSDIADRLLLIVTLSMLLTPLLFIVYDKVIAPRYVDAEPVHADDIDVTGNVVVAGSGRFGQMVNRMLRACGYSLTVIDLDASMVEGFNRFGIKTYFGDATRPELLEAARLQDANLLVVAVDNREAALRIVQHARHIRPDIPIVARAFDRLHTYDLYQAGATAIIRETFDSAVRAGRSALELLGIEHDRAQALSDLFYHRDRHSAYLMADAHDPSLPRFGNLRMIEIAQAVEAETAEMLQALLRGEPVDWKPGVENQSKR